jgi:hypothetical protein
MSWFGEEGCVATILETVQASGFAMFDLDDLPLSVLLNLLKRAGHTVSQTVITPKDRSPQSQKKTLSGIYGKNAFPYHTDFAFKPTPPKFVVLANESDHHFDRPTFVSSLSDLPSDMTALLKDASWILRSRLSTFIVSSWQTVEDHILLKWDLDFLTPYNSSAQKSAGSIPPCLASQKKEVAWSPRSAVMINNWVCAHARGGATSAPSDDDARRLIRYEVWNHA